MNADNTVKTKSLDLEPDIYADWSTAERWAFFRVPPEVWMALDETPLRDIDEIKELAFDEPTPCQVDDVEVHDVQ